MRPLAVALILAATACESALPPLRKVGEVGRDPVVLFVGGDGAGQGDLFAVPTSGGEATQLTFSSVSESRPALSPDGGAVAFLRTSGDSTRGAVWVMNLVSGAEREVELPRGAGAPTRVGWVADGGSIVVATTGGLYRAPAPPEKRGAVPVPPAERAAAESALSVLLGSPAFARVTLCDRPEDLCVVGDTGAPELLAKGARDGARWGSDSVAYFIGDELLVRPLGPGRERTVELKHPPAGPREATMFPGAVDSSSSP